MKYGVLMSAKASVSTYHRVEADSLEEAGKLAAEAAYGGDVSWRYDGTDDSTVEITEVRAE